MAAAVRQLLPLNTKSGVAINSWERENLLGVFFLATNLASAVGHENSHLMIRGIEIFLGGLLLGISFCSILSMPICQNIGKQDRNHMIIRW